MSEKEKPELEQLDQEPNESSNALESIDLEHESDHEPEEIITENHRKKKSGSTFKWIFILLILAALAYGIYYAWQQWQTNGLTNTDNNNASPQNELISQLNQQLKVQDSKIQRLQQDHSQQINETRAQFEQQLNAMQQQLARTQRIMQNSSADQSQQWAISEAEYLIRQASQKLYFSQDARSIIALLHAADQQLLSINKGNVHQLRQAISNDINAIRGSGNLDIEGIAVKIQTLKQAVPELELASVQLQPSDEIAEQNDQELSAWQHFKQSASNAFSKYYKVHKYDESVKPFVSPQNDHVLRQNILLNLQTAQLAAMQHNQAVYQDALQEMQPWLNQFFKQNQATTQAFQTQVSELLNANVNLDLPSQLDSLNIVKQLSEQMSQQISQQAPQKLSVEAPVETPADPQIEAKDGQKSEQAIIESTEELTPEQEEGQ